MGMECENTFKALGRATARPNVHWLPEPHSSWIILPTLLCTVRDIPRLGRSKVSGYVSSPLPTSSLVRNTVLSQGNSQDDLPRCRWLVSGQNEGSGAARVSQQAQISTLAGSKARFLFVPKDTAKMGSLLEGIFFLPRLEISIFEKLPLDLTSPCGSRMLEIK